MAVVWYSVAKSGLTKRAVDGGDSAAFTSIFLASGFFLLSCIFPARPTTTNANRWLAPCKIMNNKNKLIVFLDTSVLLQAFAAYHHNHELPSFINDQETRRFTFEKCIYEAYMAFRGIGGKKPSEGRTDWAPRHLKGEDDPKSVNYLANKFHEGKMPLAFFWTNHIDGIEPDNYADITYSNPEKADKFYQDLDNLSELKNQRRFFETLCDEFRKMLKDNNVTILSYMDIFGDDPTWASNIGIDRIALDAYTLDSFARNTVIPSEDFECVFAASRIFADIFVANDNDLIKCAWSLGVNAPLSPAAFCRSEEYESKKQEYKSGSVVAKSHDKK